jgi:uncharacterized membrane protein
MLFISILKEYVQILLAFGIGLAGSVTLSMIPGLVYFIVFAETGVYILLRKLRLLQGIRRAVVDQSVFQGVVTLSLVLAAPWLVTFLTADVVSQRVFSVTLLAVFLHLLLLTLLNLQFYMELYKPALAAAVVFFSVNTGLSFLFVATPGLSYLVGAGTGAVVAALLLHRGTQQLDRRILAGTG